MAGVTFTISGPDANGLFIFTPNVSPLTLPLATGGTITFSINVIKLPSGDSNAGFAGKQVIQHAYSICNQIGGALTGGGNGTSEVTVQNPCLQVTKLVACSIGGTTAPIADCPASGYVSSATGIKGDTQDPSFCYSITITNCGDVAWAINGVQDSALGDLTAAFPAGLPAHTGTAILYGPVDTAATTINTLTVNVTNTDSGVGLTGSSSATASVVQASVSCLKRITSVDGVSTNLSALALADTADHTATYTIGVTAGPIDLTGVMVDDVLLSNVCDSLPAGPFDLAAGQSTNFTCSSVLVNCTNLSGRNADQHRHRPGNCVAEQFAGILCG